jgi:signal transduction histidine kinase
MDSTQLSLLTPLLAAGGYVTLLFALLSWRSEQERQVRWLQGFLVLSIVWQLMLLPFPIDAYVPNLSTKTLLTGTLLLGMTTAVYLDWPRRRQWILFGSTAVVTTLALDFALPTMLFPLPADVILQPTIGGLASLIVWLILSASLLLATWRNYQKTPLPWHANRLLYWAIALLITFVGEALLFYNLLGLTVAGQIIRFLGVVALAYGASSHRIFDVQTRLQRALGLLAVTLLSAIAALLVFRTTLFVTQSLPDRNATLILFLVVAAGFVVYGPSRRALEQFLQDYLQGEELETSTAVRNYSQSIARTLDVEQLSILIIGTLSELLEINRGALILLTKVDDAWEVEAIPAMGAISREKVSFPKDTFLFQTLANLRQPLLQYELDFSREFQALSERERKWLAEQSMEVYVPISTAAELTGLIALGPKSSGRTYRPTELELVQIMADQTVVALQNARLYSELNAQNEKVRLLNVDLRRQNERLEIMDKVKSDFITIASHELRTPLTQVKGYADILEAMNEESALTREQTREIVGHVNRASHQLESLISAMLDASQLDVNGMQLTFMQAKLETIVRLAVEPMAKAMRERRMALKLEGIQEIPPLHCDFKRMVQAVSNLLGNAVKYTPDGGCIRVSATLLPNEETDDEYVEIVVADTGIGIDPKYQELIFEKFFRIGDPQLHSTGITKFKGAGPGLGLPIARGVVEAHGGRIWVESEGENELRLPGSKFHLIVPVCPPGALEQEQQEMARLNASDRPSWLIG